MFHLDHPQKTPLFNYYAPLGGFFRGIISVPHSGENIPDDFLPFLTGDVQAYNEDLDFKVNELINLEELQNQGIAVIISKVHRVCVDLNRSEDNCVLFWKQNTKGKQIVLRSPTTQEAEHLKELYYRPYFEILKMATLELQKKKRGPVSMIDLHSMPSKPTAYHLKQNPQQTTSRAQFCLSDRRGLTCSQEFIHFFEKKLNEFGYETALNNPYVGGFITEFMNQFKTNNIQIEINRSIYMDEEKKSLLPDRASSIKESLTKVLLEAFDKFDT